MRVKQFLIGLTVIMLMFLLGGCRFGVVESESIQIGWLFSAHAAEQIGIQSRDSGDDTRISQMQEQLSALNYLYDTVDGIFGKNTETALLEFQQMNNLPETGVLDDQTQAALFSETTPPVRKPVTEPYGLGATGRNVQFIQKMMRVYGFTAEPIDGTYSKETCAVVLAFQKYAVEHYGTEFDELLPETAPVPEFGSVEAEVQETSIPEMPVLTPEATLRPDYEFDGEVSVQLFHFLEADRLAVYRETLQLGDSGEEVIRLQNRLITLECLYEEADGAFGALTESALKYFQSRNALQETGIADPETQKRLFSTQAIAAEAVDKPYYIKISLDDQKVYVYRWRDGGYTHLIKTMICSTGTSGHATPKGVFTSAGHSGGRWHYFKEFDCWAQYAFNIHNNILFHSVIYSQNDTSTLRSSSVNNLGRRASHGCIRLKVADAKWIYMNCERGQVVEVY